MKKVFVLRDGRSVLYEIVCAPPESSAGLGYNMDVKIISPALSDDEKQSAAAEIIKDLALRTDIC